MNLRKSPQKRGSDLRVYDTKTCTPGRLSYYVVMMCAQVEVWCPTVGDTAWLMINMDLNESSLNRVDRSLHFWKSFYMIFKLSIALYKDVCVCVHRLKKWVWIRFVDIFVNININPNEFSLVGNTV